MTDAPERIWAFYAPHVADDENGATIVAYTEKQYGGHEYIRADLHDAQLTALREENRELAMQIIASDGQAHDAYSETLALRDRVESLKGHLANILTAHAGVPINALKFERQVEAARAALKADQ